MIDRAGRPFNPWNPGPIQPENPRPVDAAAIDRIFAGPHSRGCECSDCDGTACCEGCDERHPLALLDADGFCGTCNAEGSEP